MTVKLIQTMKSKYYIFCILFSCISLSASAQGKFSLGIDAGVRNEKARFDDPQGYIYRDLYPRGTVGITVGYFHSERWEFEIGFHRTTFSSSANAFYNEPGFKSFSRYGKSNSGGFPTLQVPIRGIFKTGIDVKKIELNLFGGLILYQQINNSTVGGSRGSGTDVFPQPAPRLALQYDWEVLAKSSLAFELGTELRYKISDRFHLAYRFSGTLGTRDMIVMEGNYNASNNPQVIHDFEVLQRGTSLNHFLSIRYKLGKKIEKEKWWE